MVQCARCNKELSPQARFCDGCGAAVSNTASERRVVSVLFGDVVGYTAWSEGRDPETVKRTVDELFSRLGNDVAAYGGTVDKIVGDEIMAVFGIPSAHADDPERAVRAGLAIQRTVAEHPSGLRLRIGINTGEVVVGGVSTGEVTAIGDTVNVASRLEGAAEPGTVCVSRSTYELTKDAIMYTELGSVDMRNRAEAVEIFRADSAVARPGDRTRRHRAPLIGRDTEAALLDAAIAHAFHARRPLLALITGDAGMGKSRVAEQAVMRSRASHAARVATGRCPPYGEANPWWPIAEVLHQTFGIDASTPADLGRERITQAIQYARGEVDPVSVEGLAALLGYSDALSSVEPERARATAEAALVDLLEGLSATRPVFVLIQELHWADRLVLDLLDDVLGRLHGSPIAIVCTARADITEHWEPAARGCDLLTMNLQPLSAEAVAELAAALGADPETTRIVVERAGGNPFYIEEIVAGGGRDLGTLRQFVAARIDDLNTDARATLFDAAIIGNTGPLDAVEHLAAIGGHGYSLQALVEAGVLAVGEGTYAFVSDLFRETAYRTMTRADRAARHVQIAKWLAAAPRSAPDRAGQIARHWAEAAASASDMGPVDGVPADVVEIAITHLRDALDAPHASDSAATVRALADRALILVGEGPRSWPFRLARANAGSARSDFDFAREEAQEVLDEATEAADHQTVGRALVTLADIYRRKSSLAETVNYADRAVDAYVTAGDLGGEANATRIRGFASLFLGRLDDAARDCRRALTLFRDAGDLRGEGWALQNLGWVAFLHGQMDDAEEWVESARDVFKRTGDVRGESWTIGMRGWISMTRGDLDGALVDAEAVIPLARRYGDHWGEGLCLMLRGDVNLWQGRTSEAADDLRAACEVFRQINEIWSLSRCLPLYARACLAIGDDATAALAEAEFNELVEVSPEIDAEWVRQASNMTILLWQGRAAEPKAQLQAVHGLGEEIAGWFLVAAMQAGDIDAARTWIPEVLEAVTNNTPGDRARASSTVAFAHLINGEPRSALEAVESMLPASGGTYLDRVFANCATAIAHVHLGDEQSARDAVQRARSVLEGITDRVTAAIVDSCEAVVSGAPGTPNGWHTAFSLLTRTTAANA